MANKHKKVWKMIFQNSLSRKQSRHNYNLKGQTQNQGEKKCNQHWDFQNCSRKGGQVKLETLILGERWIKWTSWHHKFLITNMDSDWCCTWQINQKTPRNFKEKKMDERENQAANLSPGEEDVRKERHVQKKRDIETVFESLRCMGRQTKARQCLPHTWRKRVRTKEEVKELLCSMQGLQKCLPWME
jgi:hypothetical protein